MIAQIFFHCFELIACYLTTGTFITHSNIQKQKIDLIVSPSPCVFNEHHRHFFWQNITDRQVSCFKLLWNFIMRFFESNCSSKYPSRVSVFFVENSTISISSVIFVKNTTITICRNSIKLLLFLQQSSVFKHHDLTVLVENSTIQF